MSTDADLIERFTKERATPKAFSTAESLTMRALVLAASPMWLATLGAAALARLVRLRLPVFVLHERCGFQRRRLWVPKIGTAAVAGNERRLLGLIELATGPPVELDVESNVEQLLRRTGADELPQLLLVLTGSMRLVGPRPVTPDELKEMLEAGSEVGVDHLHPGIVGLWQVLDRHAYTLAERRDLDMLMISNWSSELRRSVLKLAFKQAAARIRSTR